MKSSNMKVIGVRAAAGIMAGLAGAARGDNTAYQVNSLVSDGAVPAAHVDPHLVNPWGIAFNPTAFDWVADADAGYSTLYDGDGVPQSLVVQIPDENGVPTQGHPTGIVFYGGTGFQVTQGNSAKFMFATENGTITAWAPGVDMTHALTMVDETPQGASFKSLAVATGTPAGDVIYASDFANAVVRVYDSKFKAANLPGKFTDPGLPNGFAPFGIQNIDNTIFVAFAMQDPDSGDELHGPGLGYVDAFDVSGAFLRRVVSKGVLNAPWGLAKAPDDFGQFGGRLLVGNFGDGRINAFDDEGGEFKGALNNPGGTPIEINGLWGIAFGNGHNNQPTNALFFAAGINDEADGLYGSITMAPCYADFDKGGTLDLFDFLAFVNSFNANDPAADCDGNGFLDLFDFLCFVNAFNGGC